MVVPEPLRPHRGLAFPFAIVLIPSLALVVREAGISAVGNPITLTARTALALTVGAILVSYLLAVVASALFGLREGPVPSWAKHLIRPSNWTLTILTAILLATGTYVVAGSLGAVPGWVDEVARAIGALLGWPLFVVFLVLFAVENALGGRFPFALQVAVLWVGLALATTWTFVLSGWIATSLPGGSMRASE